MLLENSKTRITVLKELDINPSFSLKVTLKMFMYTKKVPQVLQGICIFGPTEHEYYSLPSAELADT